MKATVGLSLPSFQDKYGDMLAIEKAKEAGCNSIDLSLTCFDYRKEGNVYSKSDEEIVEYFTALRKRAEELGLVISQTHGRIEGFKNIKEEDDALVANARLDCLATATLGAPYCIIHSVTSIFMGPAPDRQLMQDLNFDMFNRMIPFAKQYGIKLSSETFGDAMKYDEVDFFGQIDQFIMSYNRICAAGDNAKYMSVCVDTGHSNKASRFGQPSPADVIRMLGSNVKTLHLNDNNKLVDQHKIPLTGCIDWEDTLNALDEIGYDGVFNMELALNNCGGKGMEFESAVYANQVMKNLLKLRGWEVE